MLLGRVSCARGCFLAELTVYLPSDLGLFSFKEEQEIRKMNLIPGWWLQGETRGLFLPPAPWILLSPPKVDRWWDDILAWITEARKVSSESKVR